jgi:cytidylate kinase
VASRLGLRYLDTGAQFRAVTWWMLRQGIDVHDPAAVAARVGEPLLALQREIIGAGGIVVEGRDIGSVVCPDADVKVFLTADPGARAARRAAEEGGSDLSRTEQSLRHRDRIDSGRSTAPLVMPDGAVHVDTTAYTLEEVIDLVAGLAHRVPS